MESRSRYLLVGGIMAAVILGGLAVGFVLLRSESSSTPSESPTPVATEERLQVERAYLRFWDAWAKANESLDPTVLDKVMTGEALEQARVLVEEGRAKNAPIRIRVEHNYHIAITHESLATVEDSFLDRSVDLDPETRQPVGPEVNETIRNSYTLKKVNGIWKVAEIIAYRSPSP